MFHVVEFPEIVHKNLAHTTVFLNLRSCQRANTILVIPHILGVKIIQCFYYIANICCNLIVLFYFLNHLKLMLLYLTISISFRIFTEHIFCWNVFSVPIVSVIGSLPFSLLEWILWFKPGDLTAFLLKGGKVDLAKEPFRVQSKGIPAKSYLFSRVSSFFWHHLPFYLEFNHFLLFLEHLKNSYNIINFHNKPIN